MVDAAVMKKNNRVVCISWKGKNAELIYSDGSQIQIEENPFAWFSKQILVNGSTLQGRIDAFRRLIQASQKPCILISERSQDLYFPTKGLSNSHCQWYLYQEVISVDKINESHTDIHTRSGQILTADVNIRTVQLQMKRCVEFLNAINPV